MRIGICTTVDNIKSVEETGFDYIEFALNWIGTLSDDEFLKVKGIVDESPIKCEACNCFFPWDMRITGASVDENAILEYIRKAIQRASLLGMKIAVVGNGGARKAAEGWSKEKAIEQFASVMVRIGDEARQYGITAVVEPLNLSETNIVNSINEGLELVKSINHPNIRLLADFYHMRRESEDMQVILETGGYLRHLHIANSNGRRYPADKNEDQYISFFNALKKIGYDGRISIEASTDDFKADAKKALSLLRELSG